MFALKYFFFFFFFDKLTSTYKSFVENLSRLQNKLLFIQRKITFIVEKICESFLFVCTRKLCKMCIVKCTFYTSMYNQSEHRILAFFSSPEGELIGWPCSGVRPSVRRPSVRRRRPQFQRSSSLKPLGRSS